MNDRKNYKKKAKEWKSPIISKMNISLTKGGNTLHNNENKNFYTFGGQAGS